MLTLKNSIGVHQERKVKEKARKNCKKRSRMRQTETSKGDREQVSSTSSTERPGVLGSPRAGLRVMYTNADELVVSGKDRD